MSGQKGIAERHVQKSRTVDADFGKVFVFRQFFGNKGSDFTRIFTLLFGQRQRAVALKVAQIRPVGNLNRGHLRIKLQRRKDLPHFLVDDIFQRQIHNEMFLYFSHLK